MGVYRKAKVHIENFARIKTIHYAVHDILRTVNRYFSVPFLHSYLIVNFSYSPTEKPLEGFMFPRNNGCFIDAGANIGLWTFLLAQKGFEVHSFEPSPRAFSFLKKKTRKFGDIHLYGCALGDKNCVAGLNIHRGWGHDSIVHKQKDYTGNTVEIDVRTLDSFAIENVGLIKIDTEGYEIPVLRGATKTILSNKPRLVIEVHEPIEKQQEEITAILKNFGYKWITLYRRIVYPVNPQPHIIADPI